MTLYTKPKGVYVQMPDNKSDFSEMLEWAINIVQRMDEENNTPFSSALRSDIGNFLPNAQELIELNKQ